MSDLGTPITPTTFEAHTLGDLPYAEMREILWREHFLRVVGLFDPSEILEIRRNIQAGFSRSNDRKHDPSDLDALFGNLQKLQVAGGSANNCARFLRILYNPIFASDVYGMKGLFSRLCRFRNLLYGAREDFALEGIENGYWTASRLNQYPRGGGFMATHSDRMIYGEANASEPLILQPLLVMTKKGVDFHSGGAFVEFEKERIDLEAGCNVGDVLVYDGRLRHGVADIDPIEPLDLENFTGRISAFVTLFRVLKNH